MENKMHIALAGNPNCGKTTLFNELTGSNGYVGNWPGVTVEKKEAACSKDKSVILTDLPGIYSLSPYSPEEVVSRDYLLDGDASAVINLVDATNLERNLYLTTQILECGLPAVLGLNMNDLLEKRGDKIDADRLSKKLGVPVVFTSALRAKNVDELVETAKQLAESGAEQKAPRIFTEVVESALVQIEDTIQDLSSKKHLRWNAIKIFERDEMVLSKFDFDEPTMAHIEDIISKVEAEFDDDSASIITSERYEWIAGVIAECVVPAPKKLSWTEKVDRVVTNRILGLPIFILVMTLVYYVSTSSVAAGTAATDFVNDNIFGDGWYSDDGISYVFTHEGEHMGAYEDAVADFEQQNYEGQIESFIAAAEEKGLDTEGVEEAATAEEPTAEQEELLASFVEAAAGKDVVVKDFALKDADDNFLDADGEPVVTIVKDGEEVPQLEDGQKLMTIDIDAEEFVKAYEAEEPSHEEFGNWINGLPVVIQNGLENMGASEAVVSLVIDGVVAGVGAVLGFLPQMFFLFCFLSFLEDCGYMSRVAFVMDRVFRKFGLSGKSFIPMLVSAGCAVPGIMATKTIENENDRRMTIMTVPFIPCGAKLPIIALLMGALVGGEGGWWVAPMFYFLGVFAVIISGIMLKKTKRFAGDPTPFIMELPEYHIPRFKSWLLHVWERLRSFIAKAGTIIFAASVLIWFLSSFGFAGWEGGTGAFGYLPSLPEAPEDFIEFSLLAGFGNAVKFLFAPLGFAKWKAVAATVSGLIAKENLVSTYAVLFGLGELGESATVLWSQINLEFTVNGVVHTGSLIAFMAFNMLCAPCFAAMGAMRNQLNNNRWWGFAIAYETGFAWVIALLINQFYELIVFGNFGFWTIVAFVALGYMLYMLFKPAPQAEEKVEVVVEEL